jgi:hypothetical protein
MRTFHHKSHRVPLHVTVFVPPPCMCDPCRVSFLPFQTTCNSLRAQLDALKSEHMERAVAAGTGHAADKADSAGMRGG